MFRLVAYNDQLVVHLKGISKLPNVKYCLIRAYYILNNTTTYSTYLVGYTVSR